MAGETNNVVDQVECFRCDHLRRLKDDWTEASLSCATPQRTGVDPYRLSGTHVLAGNRVTQTSWSSPTLTAPRPPPTRPSAAPARMRSAPSPTPARPSAPTPFTYNELKLEQPPAVPAPAPADLAKIRARIRDIFAHGNHTAKKAHSSRP
jgi:hypothetical protein